MKKLIDLGEDRITRELILPKFPSVSDSRYGADDCALLRRGSKSSTLVHTTDPGPTPVVFELFEPDYFHLGWMTVTVNASDIASMGAKPEQMLLSVEAPEQMSVFDFDRMLEGVAAGAEAMGVRVAGGNLRDAERVRLTGTMIGAVPSGEPLRRGGGKIGNAIWAVGQTAHFWLSVLLCLRRGFKENSNSQNVTSALLKPMAKTAFGMALQRSGHTATATDASDGLMSAIGSIASTAGCAANVDILRLEANSWAIEMASELGIDYRTCALAWGDWQILTAIEPELGNEIRTLASNYGLHAMHCGDLVEGKAGEVHYTCGGAPVVPPDLRSKKFSQRHREWSYSDWADLIGSYKFAN
ncbi:thiamine-phosphate kinase [Roseibium sp.]|uniref:thiamine-phosphate kinase n=1 Tax=Roseibium sp. TaxID=1936156 RepID=UPI003BAACB52